MGMQTILKAKRSAKQSVQQPSAHRFSYWTENKSSCWEDSQRLSWPSPSGPTQHLQSPGVTMAGRSLNMTHRCQTKTENAPTWSFWSIVLSAGWQFSFDKRCEWPTWRDIHYCGKQWDRWSSIKWHGGYYLSCGDLDFNGQWKDLHKAKDRCDYWMQNQRRVL